ncbi:MAG: hypothetical protein FGM62_02955 [Methylobacterium sp.]|nr:hypothetical protein [Methylobacterium sp.]
MAPAPGSRRTYPTRCRGAALILLVLVLVFFLLGYQIHQLRPEMVSLQRAEKTASALSEARQLLMARAVLDADRPGSLPCPDADANGSADLFAGNDCPQYLARFPWRTLGSGKLTDADGELLWYALSRNHRDDDSAQPLHLNLPAQLRAGAVDDVVAVVVAPGAPLPEQTGRPGNDVHDYLEGENADGDQSFVAFPAGPDNDRIVWITRTDLKRGVAQIILKRIAGDANSGLLQFRLSNGVFPHADSNGDGYPDAGVASGTVPYQALNYPVAIKQMLIKNDWFKLAAYSVDAGSLSSALTLHENTITLP